MFEGWETRHEIHIGYNPKGGHLTGGFGVKRDWVKKGLIGVLKNKEHTLQ